MTQQTQPTPEGNGVEKPTPQPSHSGQPQPQKSQHPNTPRPANTHPQTPSAPRDANRGPRRDRRGPGGRGKFGKTAHVPQGQSLFQQRAADLYPMQNRLVAWDEVEKPSFHFKPHAHTTPPENADEEVTVHPTDAQKLHVPPVKPGTFRLTPIGGLNEIGGNSMILETEEDMFVIDYGMLFPGKELPGIDYIIPDLSYVFAHKHKFRGFMITHGHLDHIGALRHVLQKLNFPPVYAPKFAMALLKKQLEEEGFLKACEHQLHVYDPDGSVMMGKIKFEFFRVDHSIPDCVGLYIQTPYGNVIHTGDFRIDSKPGEPQKKADVRKIAEYGRRGVDLLMSDSTCATIPGKALPEDKVIENLEEYIANAPGRVIITTFSTLVERIQQIIHIADRTGRTVFINGRSMLASTILARDLGLVKFKEGLVKRVTKNIQKMDDEKVIIVTTGSQGEPLAGLTRMATGAHPHIQIQGGDLIIHSARIIPDKEQEVLNMINLLIEKGAKVLFKYNSGVPFHTSGHGYRDDLKYMLDLAKPKYFMPLHGELFMRQAHGELGMEMGLPKTHVLMVNNGELVEISPAGVKRIAGERIPLIDGIVENGFEGFMDDSMINERKMMRDQGMVTVLFKVDRRSRRLLAHPKVISRGFVFRNALADLHKELMLEARKHYERFMEKEQTPQKQKELVGNIRYALMRFLGETYEKRPLILPVIIEI